MDDSTRPQSENEWTVVISVRERDGQTRATARLQFGEHEAVGVGLARLGPAERGSTGTGGELAVAEAVSDLARRLKAPAVDGDESSFIAV
jgi:hypothetical protein